MLGFPRGLIFECRLGFFGLLAHNDVVVGEVEVEVRVLEEEVEVAPRFDEVRVDFEGFGARVVEGAGFEGVGEGVVVVGERL